MYIVQDGDEVEARASREEWKVLTYSIRHTHYRVVFVFQEEYDDAMPCTAREG